MVRQGLNGGKGLLRLGLLALICWGLVPSSAQAAVLFYDGFDTAANDVDRSVWTTPTGDAGYFGRTAIRRPPPDEIDGFSTTVQVADGAAQLLLSTYNPTNENNNIAFWGSEIDTIETWAPTATVAISFEASVRLQDGIPPGVVAAVFAFGPTGTGTQKDEIDIEFLSNLYLGSDPQALLNRFVDEPATSAGTPQAVDLEPAVTGFQTYRIDWYQDRIEWYVNDQLLAVATDGIPTHEVGLRLNIWAPGPEFALAYDAGLQPTDDPTRNLDYLYEVDWVRVSRLNPVPEPATVLLFSLGMMGAVMRRRRGV